MLGGIEVDLMDWRGSKGGVTSGMMGWNLSFGIRRCHVDQTYREDEACPQSQRPAGRRLGSLKGGDGVENRLDVLGLGEAGLGHGTGRGAQLEVDDAIVGKVAEDGEGRVGERPGVVDEAVDVLGEEGEESGRASRGDSDDGF